MPNEILQYLKIHSLETLFKELLATILSDKPQSPIDFMIYALQQLKQHPSQTDYRQFFKTCSIEFSSMQHHSAASIEMPVECNIHSSEAKDIVLDDESHSDNSESQHQSNNEDVLEASTVQVESQRQPVTFSSCSNSASDKSHQSPTVTSQLTDAPIELLNFNRSRRSAVSSEPLCPSQDSTCTHEIHPKTEHERETILKSIQSNFLFKSLESDQLDDFINALFPIDVEPGRIVIKQHDQGDNVYVIQEGNFDIIVDDKSVSTIGPGCCFGELALMYNTPRAATVQARERAKLWALDRFTFRKMLTNNIYHKRNLYLSFLRSVPIFESLSDDELSRIADALEVEEFMENQHIITQGEIGDKFFIVVNGEAAVTIERDGEIHLMDVLGQGKYFGEIAMLTKAPRHATVVAKSPKVKCISLESAAFTRLLGPIENILKRNMDNYRKYEEYI